MTREQMFKMIADWRGWIRGTGSYYRITDGICGPHFVHIRHGVKYELTLAGWKDVMEGVKAGGVKIEHGLLGNCDGELTGDWYCDIFPDEPRKPICAVTDDPIEATLSAVCEWRVAEGEAK